MYSCILGSVSLQFEPTEGISGVRCCLHFAEWYHSQWAPVGKACPRFSPAYCFTWCCSFNSLRTSAVASHIVTGLKYKVSLKMWCVCVCVCQNIFAFYKRWVNYLNIEWLFKWVTDLGSRFICILLCIYWPNLWQPHYSEVKPSDVHILLIGASIQAPWRWDWMWMTDPAL